ncbi:MAG: hypothetical protein JWQ07_1250 [Ramlibacter sp.]|nr:hypothetical protein [Ramlibacter sp.]
MTRSDTGRAISRIAMNSVSRGYVVQADRSCGSGRRPGFGNRPLPVNFFDVARFNSDTLTPMRGAGRLLALCRNMVVQPVRIPYHPRWKCAITVFQPRAEWFQGCLECLHPFVSVEAAGAEVARDYVCASPAQAVRVERMLLRHAWVLHSQQRVERIGSTSYWTRAHKSGLVVYADHMHKHSVPGLPQPCCHTEIRLRGVRDLRAAGLWKLGDFIQFDWDAFWRDRIRFYALPHEKGALGRLADSRSTNTRTAATYRNWVDEASLPGVGFVLQNFALAHGAVKGRLVELSADRWLDAVCRSDKRVLRY